MDQDNEPLAGRELDAAIARWIFGWKSWANSSVNSPFFMSPETRADPCMEEYGLIEVESGNEENTPHYSTDIALAILVVEKLRGDGWSFACTLYEGRLPYASFCKGTAASGRNAEADSLSQAICRAALATRSF